jgi:hypothetical protein
LQAEDFDLVLFVVGEGASSNGNILEALSPAVGTV